MGNKGGKAKKVSNKPPKLSSKDYKFLVKQTGMSKDQITDIFNKFNENNPDGVLNNIEFARLYIELRPEPAETIDEIAQYVFGAFDADNSGSINFNEFMVRKTLNTKLMRIDLKTF